MSKIGEYLMREREKQNISIRELSKLSDVSFSEITKIEKGMRLYPSPISIKAIASVWVLIR